MEHLSYTVATSNQVSYTPWPSKQECFDEYTHRLLPHIRKRIWNTK